MTAVGAGGCRGRRWTGKNECQVLEPIFLQRSTRPDFGALPAKLLGHGLPMPGGGSGDERTQALEALVVRS